MNSICADMKISISKTTLPEGESVPTNANNKTTKARGADKMCTA